MSDTEKTIPYDDIPNAPFDIPTLDERFGTKVFRDIQELQVGISNTVFRANQSGVWLGDNTFANAPFSVDMDGNVIAHSFKTGTTGQHIAIDSATTNRISFFDNTTLFGLLEVDYDAGTDIGCIKLLAQDLGAGLEIDVGIGASAFSSINLFANGGSFDSQGNASNHYLSMLGAQGGTFQVKSESGSSNEQVYSDLDIDTDGLINMPQMTTTVANARPFVRDGSVIEDGGVLKVKLGGTWKTITAV